MPYAPVCHCEGTQRRGNPSLTILSLRAAQRRGNP